MMAALEIWEIVKTVQPNERSCSREGGFYRCRVGNFLPC